MEARLFEVTDRATGERGMTPAVDDKEANMIALQDGFTRPTARLWKIIEGDDYADMKRQVDAEIARWQDLEAVTPRGQAVVAPLRQEAPDSAHDDGQQPAAIVSASGQSEYSIPEREANVQAAPLEAIRGTASPQSPPHIEYIGRNRGGRPVQGIKWPLNQAILDYYRTSDGFQRDLEFILSKTGCGVSGLGRALHTDRRRVHGWRDHGAMPADPVTFLQVVLWVAHLRKGRWPWQR